MMCFSRGFSVSFTEVNSTLRPYFTQITNFSIVNSELGQVFVVEYSVRFTFVIENKIKVHNRTFTAFSKIYSFGIITDRWC